MWIVNLFEWQFSKFVFLPFQFKYHFIIFSSSLPTSSHTWFEREPICISKFSPGLFLSDPQMSLMLASDFTCLEIWEPSCHPALSWSTIITCCSGSRCSDRENEGVKGHWGTELMLLWPTLGYLGDVGMLSRLLWVYIEDLRSQVFIVRMIQTFYNK